MKTAYTLANECLDALARARELHPSMQSRHEGYAVILEELDELWGEIKKKDPNVTKMRKEALHVAAMAMRFILDVCDDGHAGSVVKE